MKVFLVMRLMATGLMFIACLGCSDSRSITFGGVTYAVPRENLRDSASSIATRNSEAMDHSEELPLRFGSMEIQRSVPRFQRVVAGAGSVRRDEELRVLIGFPSAETRAGILSGQIYQDLWRGTGDYGTNSGMGRDVEPDRQAGGFRVYRRGLRDSWILVDRNPEAARVLPPFNAVIANCGVVGGMQPTTYVCGRVLYADGLIIDYEISRENVALYREIDAFILGRLRSWRR
jgi:hypothetical protein